MADKGFECPVFRPTLDEVRNLSFAEYVESVEPKWLHVGICKIVAPEGWTPRRAGYDDLDHIILPKPIRQHATGRQGLYRTLLVEQRSLPLPTFKEMAEDQENAPPQCEPEVLERKFWKNVPMNPPLYGADVPGSLFDDRLRGWNLKKLSSILSTTLQDNGAAIPGVTQPYLYAGSWRAFFAWHTEDLDLHSVNYLHTGAPKTWYVIPPAARERFELFARDLLPELSRSCSEFLRHKEILLSPALLAAHSIPLVKVVHRAREFVVVGPGAYHAGFNHGYNIAESVNFATPAWVPIGAQASFCTCRSDSVKIDMRLFVDYMDEQLAEEVMDSYESEEDDGWEDIDEGDMDTGKKKGRKTVIDMDEEEEALGGSEEEEEEEEAEEEEAESDDDDDEESEDEDEDDTSEEEEEELPEKRVRKPSYKAAESGLLFSPSLPMHHHHHNSHHGHDKVTPLRRSNKHHLRKIQTTISCGKQSHLRQSRLPKEQAPLHVALKRRPPSSPAKLPSTASVISKNSKRRAAAAGRKHSVNAATAAAHVNASSDDDSSGGLLRSASKRGAAKAWYRLFDSLLPSLKRARA